MKEFNQPQFALAIKNNLCSFIGFINDIPAFINKRGTAYNLCVPINHLVKNGENTFKVIITPLSPSSHLEELSECSATVIVKDVTDNATDFKGLTEMSFAPGTSNDSIRLPAFELAGGFEAKLSYPDYQWVDAPKLDENRQQSIEKASKFFNRFHQAFGQKDTGRIYEAIASREMEMSNAFYESFEKGMAGTREDIEGTLNDPNYVLQPLDFTGFLPVFYADSRIISFMNEKYEQPIFFLNDREGYRREYPLYLCMDPQNECMIIR